MDEVDDLSGQNTRKAREMKDAKTEHEEHIRQLHALLQDTRTQLENESRKKVIGLQSELQRREEEIRRLRSHLEVKVCSQVCRCICMCMCVCVLMHECTFVEDRRKNRQNESQVGDLLVLTLAILSCICIESCLSLRCAVSICICQRTSRRYL